MAMFPKIQSPCPFIDRIDTVMDGDFCRQCKRQVFDLNGMTDGERVAFMKGCSSEVCVSYRLPVGRAMAAAVTAAVLVTPVAASAQQAPVDPSQLEAIVVTIGGIKDPANTEYIQDAADAAIPELPVVYEDQRATPDGPAKSADAAPVSSRAGS
jgi:predicted Fe-S protein YdhL (DUF1289 family)